LTCFSEIGCRAAYGVGSLKENTTNGGAVWPIYALA
jgi:hypothetical protein